MKGPLVTIITPTYEHEAYIGECIESVLGQTYGNWEQIIVDDCSPDRTLEIAESYDDPRIRVIQKPSHGGPEGLHVSYNTALHLARGELVAVLEGDDYWMRDKLATQVPFHLDGNIVLSWGGCYIKNGDKLTRTATGYSHKPKKIPDTSILLIRNNILALTVMADKASLLQAGGFWQPTGTLFVDHPTWLKLSIMGDLIYIPRPLGIYRHHANQISQRYRSRMGSQNFSYVSDFISQLNQNQMQRIDFEKIRSLNAAFEARDSLLKSKYGLCLRLMVDSFRKTSVKSKYLCLKVLLCASDFP
jgi:glycosyltransferase involved in cell wall biosynthesis